MVKNPPTSAGDTRDTGLIPGLGRSPGGGYGDPLQNACLKNSMVRILERSLAGYMGVYGVTKSQTPATEYAHTFSFLLKIQRIVQFSVYEMIYQFSLHCPVLLSSICLCTVFFFFKLRGFR